VSKIGWGASTGHVVVYPSVNTAGVQVYERRYESRPVLILPERAWDGQQYAFLGIDWHTHPWYRVHLPVRPNGSSGWLHEPGAELRVVHTHVRVALRDRTAWLYLDDDHITSAAIAVGAPATPTPRGLFFVTGIARPKREGSIFGTCAIGLSGFSEVLTHFAGGPGQIGLHGTNDPSCLSKAVTHGCVRMSDESVTLFASYLARGSPVIVED
jgi:L,D-transpeptidase catalytic domain